MLMRCWLISLLGLSTLLCGCPSASSQPQESINPLKLRGSDLVPGDAFGRSVAAHGDVVVMGAPGVEETEAAFDTGAVYIVTRKAETWGAEDFRLTASDAKPKDGFGAAVAVSGDTVIVGVPDADDKGENSGAAYVFKREGSSWTEEAKLAPSNASTKEKFGRSVAVEAGTAVIGMWRDRDNSVDIPDTLLDKAYGQGSVFVFERLSDGWQETAKLIPETLTQDGVEDGFGHEVALSGGYIVVGAEYSDVDGVEDAGVAYVFRREGANWVEEAQLNASDSVKEMHFGAAVAISQNTIIVGAPGDYNKFLDDSKENDYGAAYVFVRSSEGWLEQAKLEPELRQLGDGYGGSVSIQGDRILVGAPLSDETVTNQGAAYLYQRSGSSWTLKEKYFAKDGISNDIFGGPLALGDDYAIIGAPGQCTKVGCSVGAAYIFLE